MNRLSINLLIVLCLIIGVGYVTGIQQEAVADDGPYGKYFYSLDSTQYFELKPDGKYVAAVRVHHPNRTFGEKLEFFTGKYVVKENIVKFMGFSGNVELKLEGNTLALVKKRGLWFEDAKYIKR